MKAKQKKPTARPKKINATEQITLQDHVKFISVVLWIIAAALPAYIASDTSETAYGIMCFLWGSLTFMFNFLMFIIWSANITALLGMRYLLKKNYATSIKFAAVAVICSLGSLFINEIPFDEGGSTSPVIPGIGAYIWVASITTILVGAVIARKRSSK